MTQSLVPVSLKEAKARGLKTYFTGKPCKFGHVDARRVSNRKCFQCERDTSKNYRTKNLEAVSARRASYYAKNSEHLKAYSQSWREKNPDKVRAYSQKYMSENKASILQYKLRYQSRKYNSCHEFKTTINLRNYLNRKLTRHSAEKADSALSLIGCTLGQLKAHLEKQFLPGMSWDNWSLNGWHIDHIRPCASFDLTDPKQQRECFHYTNLQPLWAKENLSKGASYDI